MPRIKPLIGSGDVEAGFDLGSQTPPELDEGGDADIQVVKAENFQDAAAQAKFMEEKVVIEIEDDPDDENAPVFVYLGHNGVTQYVQRGKHQVVKRKFLYAALAAKRVKLACAFGKDGGGNEFNRLTPSAATTYRVNLVQDNNPMGGTKWASSVMRAPG